jgi:hypothetical protein
VAITGGRDAMRKGSAIVYPVDVTVCIGQPVETQGRDIEARDEVIAEVRHRIEALLHPGRS